MTAAQRINQALDRLAALPHGWDSYGADPISRVAIANARAVVSALGESGHLDDSPPELAPGGCGGVQLEWHADGHHLELEFRPDGQCHYLLSAPLKEREGVTQHVSVVDLARSFITLVTALAVGRANGAFS